MQLLIDYLVNQTGGQMYYAGCDMAVSHQGMGITEADWVRFIAITGNVAGELGIGVQYQVRPCMDIKTNAMPGTMG